MPTILKVKVVLKALFDDGWYIARQKGSHRQLKHPTKKGRVTVAGHLNDDFKPKTLKSIENQSGLTFSP